MFLKTQKAIKKISNLNRSNVFFKNEFRLQETKYVPFSLTVECIVHTLSTVGLPVVVSKTSLKLFKTIILFNIPNKIVFGQSRFFTYKMNTVSYYTTFTVVCKTPQLLRCLLDTQDIPKSDINNKHSVFHLYTVRRLSLHSYQIDRDGPIPLKTVCVLYT